MKHPLFTIFTATYNRGYTLERLYSSLKEQTCKDFEWLIVDDGSTDDTEIIVDSWLQKESDNQFSIIYFKKLNGGKPRAINYAVTKANGKYFWIVDSDDYLTKDAVRKMRDWVKGIDNNDHFIGVGAAKGYSLSEYINAVKPLVNADGYVDATNLERPKYHLDVDMTEAYKTDIFKQFPMAEWTGEKFAPEQIALNEIALAGYLLRWHEDIIYICNYLEDGLTKNSNSLVKNNPMGYAMMYNHKLKYDLPFLTKIHAASQHIALSLYGKHPAYILRTNNLWYTLLSLPIGIVLSIRRKAQFNKIQ